MQKTIELPPIFIKVGKKEHLENLINNGEVYFGSLSDYRGEDKDDYNFKLAVSLNNLENKFPDKDFIREDPLESVQSFMYPENLDGDYKCNFHQPHTHAYSLFGFSRQLPRDFRVNDLMSKFGDHFAIFESKLFLESINPVLNQLNISNYETEYGYIKYYDIVPNINVSDLTAFHKKKRYDFQYEYRILTSLNPISDSIKGSVVNIGKSFKTLFKDSGKSQIMPISQLYSLEYNIR